MSFFDKLSRTIGLNYKNQPLEFGEEELFRTKSRDEFLDKKDRLKEKKFFQSEWTKSTSESSRYNQAYVVNRKTSYLEYEAMEYYPEIATAMDIFMEESTTVDANGIMLHVHSDSNRIKTILEDLFNNRLNIKTNLPMWTRNTVKYGDNFVLLNIDPEDGVIDCLQLPNIEIEREEGDITKVLSRDETQNSNVKFKWESRSLEFMPYQMAHFRLLGDDRRLPYGVSMLDKVKRLHRALIMAEDALLIYRVTRAAERKIFKIYVGNIDENDVQAYVQDVANRFKRKPLIDPNTGQINNKYDVNSVDQDVFVPVRDANAASPIETLPAPNNLGDIADIEFLQKKLLSALRVPKTFLNFEDAAGDGKNLALQDVRFSRTVNRIQQSMLHELNKIALIHLYILGFEDDLDSFRLSLNNPSTQQEMMNIENLQSKVNLYKDLVSDAGNGFSAMSMNKAKSLIFDMSSDEMKHDLMQQRVEKAASAELEKTANVIKKTGIFDNVDSLYKTFNTEEDGNAESEGNDADGNLDGSDFGGGSFGGGGFSDDLGGDDLGGDDLGGDDLGGDDISNELSGNDDFGSGGFDDALNEKSNKYNQIYFKRLMDYGNNNKDIINEIFNKRLNKKRGN